MRGVEGLLEITNFDDRKMEILKKNGYGIGRMSVKNSDNNYNYIVWCTGSLECAVIDPIDADVLLYFARSEGLTVKYIINTHTHPDHIVGNRAILKVTKAKILVHKKGQKSVSSRSVSVDDGSVIDIGKQKIRVIHTPGHCSEHISLILGEHIFVGDTLFLAGCGNTKYGGNLDELYETIAIKLRTLPENLIILPGHDYSEKNLRFSLSIEPRNEATRLKLEEVKSFYSRGMEPMPTTIGEEKRYNTFFRFDLVELIEELKNRNPSLVNDPRAIFKELREMRNNWN